MKSATHKLSNKFTAEKLMTMLDKEKLIALEEEFKVHPDGLEARNFVRLMKDAMNYKPEEKYDLIHGLHKLFSEIDINGDHKMQWSEFTQYVIDAVMQDGVKVGDDEKMEAKTQKEIVEEAHLKKFVRYTESTCEDRNLHEGGISKAFFIPSLHQILMVESKSTSLKFFSSELKKLQTVNLGDVANDLYPSPTSSRTEKYSVLSAAYNEKDQLLGCVCSNKTFHVFSFMGHGFKRTFVAKTKRVQYSVWFMPINSIWVTASKEPEVTPQKEAILSDSEEPPTGSAKTLWGDNYLNIWSYAMIGPKMVPQIAIKCHKSQIMDCIEISTPLSMVTCSLDRSIRAWDPFTGQKLGSFYPKHLTGVRTLDYTSEIAGGYIISVAHDNVIKIWSPETSIRQAYIGILEGHSASVVAAKFLPGTTLAISVDEKAAIRVWDVKSLSCLQVIVPENKRSKFDCAGLFVIPSERKFAVYGRRAIVYEKVTEKKHYGNQREENDEQYPVHVEFNEYYKSFVMATKIDVRIYDGVTGGLLKVFPSVLTGKGVDIAAFCLGEKHRKFYIGDINGSIRVYNASNGVLLKTIGEHEDDSPGEKQKPTKILSRPQNDHTGEISGLHFVKEDNILITTSFDSTIGVYDEENPEIAPRLRQLSGGHENSAVTSMTYSSHLGLIATGCANGSITVWDYEMSRVEGSCHLHTREVIQMQFLEEYPVLISTSTDGYCFLWGVRGCTDPKQRFACLAGLLNVFSPDEETQFALPVRSLICFVGSGTIPPRMSQKVEPLHVWKQKYDKIIGNDPTKVFLDLSKSGTSSNPKAYIVTGDEKGRVRTWDLTGLLAQLGVPPVKKPYRTQVGYFNPRRKGLVDASSQAATARSHSNGQTGPWIVAEHFLLVNDFLAHHELISAITRIGNPKGYVTASHDRHFKVWSWDGTLWGDINTAGENPVVCWKFPLDWSEERKKDKAKVIELLKQIDPTEDLAEEQLDFDNPEAPRKTVVLKKPHNRVGKFQPVETPTTKGPAQPSAKRATLKNLEGLIGLKRTSTLRNLGVQQKSMVKGLLSGEANQKHKKKGIPELDTGENDARLSKDVGALLDTYQSSPGEKKFSLFRSLESLKDKLRSDFTDILSQYNPFQCSPSAHPKMLPLYYAKEAKPLDMRTVISKYAVSVENDEGSAKKPLFTDRKFTTPGKSGCSTTRSRVTTSLSRDKSGILEGLRRLDIVKMAAVRKPVSRVASKGRDIRCTPREVERQFEKSIMSLSMKKLADIKNYNPADNAVLQQEMSMLKTFSTLPKLESKQVKSKYIN